MATFRVQDKVPYNIKGTPDGPKVPTNKALVFGDGSEKFIADAYFTSNNSGGPIAIGTEDSYGIGINDNGEVTTRQLLRVGDLTFNKTYASALPYVREHNAGFLIQAQTVGTPGNFVSGIISENYTGPNPGMHYRVGNYVQLYTAMTAGPGITAAHPLPSTSDNWQVGWQGVLINYGSYVVAVDQEAKTFTVDAAWGPSEQTKLQISSSTGNDGVYTITNTVYDQTYGSAGSMTFTVAEAIPSDVADGSAVIGSAVIEVVSRDATSVTEFKVVTPGIGYYSFGSDYVNFDVFPLGTYAEPSSLEARVYTAEYNGPFAKTTGTVEDVMNYVNYMPGVNDLMQASYVPWSDASAPVPFYTTFNLTGGMDANVDVSALPTTDPAVAGYLWVDGATLKVSLGI